MYKHYILSTALLLMGLFGNISSSSAQSGRVGIGESNPGSKGSIKGNLSVGTNYSSIAAPTNGAIIEGQVGIGASTPDASSALEISSNTKGILIPRMTTSERTSISSPATGLLVYDISLNQFWYFDGSSWVAAIGPKGDTGATGAAGATGTQGVKGDTGAAGATGAQGIKGDTGAAGATSAQGATGFLQNGTAAGQTPFWNGSSWVINDNIYNNGGNVGIGTANPLSRLRISGGGLGISGSDQAISATHGAQNSIQISSDTYYGGVHNEHSGFLMYSTMPGGWGSSMLHFAGSTDWGQYNTGTPAMVISQSGTGLSTTTPTAQLDVQGSRTIRQGNLTTYVRTLDNSNVNGTTTFNLFRQFHDQANWSVGGVLIEVFVTQYQQNLFDYSMYLARYGYSGNTADVLDKIPATGYNFSLSWGSVGTISGNIKYRDFRISLYNYRTATVRITTGLPITTDINSSTQNRIYLYP